MGVRVFFEVLLVSLLSVLAYQFIGVALFLPLELAFPKVRIPLVARVRGFIFLLAVAPVTALVAAGLETFKDAVGIDGLNFSHGLGAPVVASIALAVWFDLQFYVIHRLEHRFFWRFHAVHHSIRNLSAANSFHHWTEPLMGLTVALPLLFIEVEIAPTLGFLTFLLNFWQFYIHSSSRVHVGPLRWLVIDNRYHRIHHSVKPEHYGKNFGAMTPFWDWLFGTLYMPKRDEWPSVGLAEVEEPKSLRQWSSLPRLLKAAIAPLGSGKAS